MKNVSKMKYAATIVRRLISVDVWIVIPSYLFPTKLSDLINASTWKRLSYPAFIITAT